MRGYIYEIGVNPIDMEDCTINADVLCEEHVAEQLDVDYLFDPDKKQQEGLKSFLLAGLQERAKCIVDEDKQRFTLTAESKGAWFSDKLRKAKIAMDEMTLAEFSTDQGGKVYSLLQLIDDKIADTVYESNYDGLYHSFDDWMRNAEVGKTYYLGSVVGMH